MTKALSFPSRQVIRLKKQLHLAKVQLYWGQYRLRLAGCAHPPAHVGLYSKVAASEQCSLCLAWRSGPGAEWNYPGLVDPDAERR